MAAPADLMLGSQIPTHRLVPEYQYSRGDEAIELADMVGVALDQYQRDYLVDGLGCIVGPSELAGDEGKDVETWAAFETVIELSRQNGKSVIFEIRCLSGLYLFRERLIVYSAHKGETAMGAFQRMEELIKSNPALLSEVKGYSKNPEDPAGFKRANGKEAIELESGQKIKFRTRTKGGGRGLSGDCVILDEAQDLADDHIAALFPVLSARPNPQIWYGGSAGDKHSVVLGRQIARAEKKSPRLVCARWSLDENADPTAPASWARVNPALGRRISLSFLSSEQEAVGPTKFSRERLGQGDYPRLEGAEWVIPRRRWEAGIDRKSEIVGPVVFVPEIGWTRQSASIAVAGQRSDGRLHLEVIAHEAGTLWPARELKRLVEKHDVIGPGIAIDPASPAKTLLAPLRDLGIADVHALTIGDLTAAWGDFYDAFMAPRPEYLHLGGTLTAAAMADAATRQVGGALTWRRATTSEVAPVLAMTWAAHAFKKLREDQKNSAPPTSPVKVSGGRGATPQTRGRGRGHDVASMGF